MNVRLKTRVIELYGNQVKFCRKAGIREDRLSRLIHLRAFPSAQEKKLIARRLKVKVHEIFPD